MRLLLLLLLLPLLPQSRFLGVEGCPIVPRRVRDLLAHGCSGFRGYGSSKEPTIVRERLGSPGVDLRNPTGRAAPKEYGAEEGVGGRGHGEPDRGGGPRE